MWCKKASSHQSWRRLEQKQFLTHILPPWPPFDPFWGSNGDLKVKKIECLIKDPSITCKKASSHQIWWRSEQKWLLTPIWPPWPLLGVKWGSSNKKFDNFMNDPSITYKKASSHQIWWRLEQKWTFKTFYNPLKLKKCSVQWCLFEIKRT